MGTAYILEMTKKENFAKEEEKKDKDNSDN